MRVVRFLFVALALLAAPLTAQELIPAPQAVEEQHVLTLEIAESISLARNPRLQQAQARVEQARGQALQASLYPNPRFDPGNPQQLAGSSSLYNAGVSQPIVTAGKMKLDVAAAQREVEQANLALLRARFDLLRDVQGQFFTVLAVQDRVTTGRALVANATRGVDASQRLRNGGQIPDTDLLLARIEQNRAEATLRAAEATLSGAKQQLAAVIGVPELAIDHVQGTLKLPLSELNQFIARRDALMRNAELEIARSNIAQSQILLRRAQVEAIPNVTLQSGYQYSVQPDHNQILVGAYFDIPLWDRNQGNIRAANAVVGENVAQLGIVQNSLSQRLADAIARYRSASQFVVNYEQSILPDAQRALDLIQAGYSKGEIDLLRLLQAQRTVAEARLELISAQQDRLSAAVDITNLLQADLLH